MSYARIAATLGASFTVAMRQETIRSTLPSATPTSPGKISEAPPRLSNPRRYRSRTPPTPPARDLGNYPPKGNQSTNVEGVHPNPTADEGGSTCWPEIFTQPQ